MMEYEFIIKHYDDGKHIGTDYIGHVTPEEYCKCIWILTECGDTEQWDEIYRKENE